MPRGGPIGMYPYPCYNYEPQAIVQAAYNSLNYIIFLERFLAEQKAKTIDLSKKFMNANNELAKQRVKREELEKRLKQKETQNEKLMKQNQENQVNDFSYEISNEKGNRELMATASKIIDQKMEENNLKKNQEIDKLQNDIDTLEKQLKTIKHQYPITTLKQQKCLTIKDESYNDVVNYLKNLKKDNIRILKVKRLSNQAWQGNAYCCASRFGRYLKQSWGTIEQLHLYFTHPLYGDQQEPPEKKHWTELANCLNCMDNLIKIDIHVDCGQRHDHSLNWTHKIKRKIQVKIIREKWQ